MPPELDGLVEPEITINGTKLSFGQAMTVRVAIENLALFLYELPARQKTRAVDNYVAHIDEIRKFIFANQPPRKR